MLVLIIRKYPQQIDKETAVLAGYTFQKSLGLQEFTFQTEQSIILFKVYTHGIGYNVDQVQHTSAQ